MTEPEAPVSKIPTSFFEVTPNMWEDAKYIGQRLSDFIFRGHANNKWHLTTTIERAADRFDCSPDDRWERERNVLQAFKARAHHFLQSPPKDNENLEWLSIIQDYGGPTRLLDFTESFFVASFFAVESATNDACIWAIHKVPILFSAFEEKNIGLPYNERFSFISKPVLQFAESLIEDESKCFDLVLSVVPPRLNERLAAQQGIFLFPCNLDKKFEHNLCKSLELSFDKLISKNATIIKTDDAKNLPTEQISIMKINLPQKIHNEILTDLRSMNITSATLFPGLDGFAKSLIHSVQSLPGMFMVIKPEN